MQLIHTFHMAMNYQNHQEMLKEMKERKKVLEQKNQESSKGGGGAHDQFSVAMSFRENRSSSIQGQQQEELLPLFMVNQEKSTK